MLFWWNFSHLHWTAVENYCQDRCCSFCSDVDLQCPPNWNDWRAVDYTGKRMLKFKFFDIVLCILHIMFAHL